MCNETCGVDFACGFLCVDGSMQWQLGLVTFYMCAHVCAHAYTSCDRMTTTRKTQLVCTCMYENTKMQHQAGSRIKHTFTWVQTISYTAYIQTSSYTHAYSYNTLIRHACKHKCS
eukprot:GDKI01034886.1.p3 GENE.GDKI01034886.1~~GDKI01034886.1.p3  ORF type:complete len:115 (-),score=23.46 GDKI01034886.1:117-461(-)